MRPREWVIDLALRDDAQRGIFGDGCLHSSHPAIGSTDVFAFHAGQGSHRGQPAVEVERLLTVVDAIRSKRD